MNSTTRRALVLLVAITVVLPLACRRVNPAFNLGDGDETGGNGDGDADQGSSAEGNTSAGDGDPSTGDGDPSTGDGDPTTGDGDGEPTTTTGDGDGDPTTTTGDGDGDGDPTTDDGDGDPDGGMLVKLDMFAGDGDGDGGFIPILDMGGDGDGDCSGPNQSCALGQMCCFNLTCCEGNPIPLGQEFCSDVCPISDRNAKFAFQSVDPQWVLDQVAELPMSTWSYKDGKDGHARHIGPMAQDFQAAFGVGASDRYIFQVDADGVSLAAIQALDEKVDALEAENARLRAALQELEERLAKLEE
jgi:hypothetical protein